MPNVLAINFAYPVKHIIRDGIVDGIFLKSTKSIQIDSLIGKPVGKELEGSIYAQHKKRLKVSVGDDGLCLLLSGSSRFSSDELGFGIIGTGVNSGFFLSKNEAVILESNSFVLPEDCLERRYTQEYGLNFGINTQGGALYRQFNPIVLFEQLDVPFVHSTEELNQLRNQKIPVATRLAQTLFTQSAQLVGCTIAGITNLKQKNMVFIMEGSLFPNVHGYREILQETTSILNPLYNIEYIEIPNSGIVGATHLVK